VSILSKIKETIVINTSNNTGKFDNGTITPASGFVGLDLENPAHYKYFHVYFLIASGQQFVDIPNFNDKIGAADQPLGDALNEHHGVTWTALYNRVFSTSTFGVGQLSNVKDFIFLMKWFKSEFINETSNVYENEWGGSGVKSISGFRYLEPTSDDTTIVKPFQTDYIDNFPEARAWFESWVQQQTWAQQKNVNLLTDVNFVGVSSDDFLEAVEIYFQYLISNSINVFGQLVDGEYSYRDNIRYNLLYTKNELYRLNPLLQEEIFSYNKFKLTISVYLRLILEGVQADGATNLTRLEFIQNPDFVYYYPSKVDSLGEAGVPVDIVANSRAYSTNGLSTVYNELNNLYKIPSASNPEEQVLDLNKVYLYNEKSIPNDQIYLAPRQNFEGQMDGGKSNYATGEGRRKIATQSKFDLGDSGGAFDGNNPGAGSGGGNSATIALYKAINFCKMSSAGGAQPDIPSDMPSLTSTTENLFGSEEEAYSILKEAFGNPIDPEQLTILEGPKGRKTVNLTNLIGDMYVDEFSKEATLSFNTVDDNGIPITNQLTFFEESGDPKTDITFKHYFDRVAYMVAVEIFKLFVMEQVNIIKASYFDILYQLSQDDTLDIEDAKQKALKDLKDGIKEEATKTEAAAVAIDPKEIEAKQAVMGQCAMLANLSDMYSDYKIRTQSKKDNSFPTHGRGFYNRRFFNLTAGDANSTLNTIFNKTFTEIEKFLSITPQIQSYLVPLIKIEKVFVNTNDIMETVEIPFSNYSRDPLTNGELNLTEKLNTQGLVYKGGGAGIKSISFDFDGETPATAEKYVSATMVLFFNEFSSLFEERTTFSKFTDTGETIFEPTTFRYIDLVVNPMNTKRPEVDGRFKMEHYDPSYYRVKVTVGWSVSNNFDQTILNGSGYTTFEEFKKGIELVNKTFMMCALDHDIKIGNEGTVELQINFRGYGDTLLKSNRFNALIPVYEEMQVIEKQRDLEDLIQSGKCTNSQLIEMNASIGALRKSISLGAFKRIIENLIVNEHVHSFKIDAGKKGSLTRKAIENFKEKGFFESKPRFKIEPGSTANAINDPVFSFFYFGDLFYYLLDCVYDRDSNVNVLGAENISFILTDFEYRDWLPEKPISSLSQAEIKNLSEKIEIVPIAALPISVEYFRNWFFSNISSQNVYNKPLIDFVLEFLNDVCGCMLTEVCFSREEDKSLMFRHGSHLVDYENLSMLGGLSNASSQGSIISCDTTQFPLTTTNNRSASEYAEIIYIYMDTQPKQTGSPEEDATTFGNIPCVAALTPGSNSGIVKSANWSKTNVSYLREGRMLKNQGIGDYAQLANYYNVSLSLYGNFLFFPGMMIYIDPSYLGGNTFAMGSETPGIDPGISINFFRLMGIGGYHLITGVKSTIESGKFSTEIESRFVFSAKGDSIIRALSTGQEVESDLEDETIDPDDYSSCNNVIQSVQQEVIGTADENTEG